MFLQVSLYCTNTLFAKSHMLFLPKTWPQPGLGGWGCRGTEFGGGWRWPLHSRCNMEAVGTEEILHRHLAN